MPEPESLDVDSIRICSMILIRMLEDQEVVEHVLFNSGKGPSPYCLDALIYIVVLYTISASCYYSV